MALGVSVSVKADLGVTPISCVPYVYSLSTPLTLGELTIFMNAFFIIGQIAVLRKKYSLFQLIQFPAVAVLGYCIDFTLQLISWISPASYVEQLFWLMVSCLLLALGVFLVVKAGVTYIPGDGLIAVIAETYKKDFGKMKMCFDSSMVVIGLLSSFALLGRLAGIREGTFIAALTVGFLIQVYNKAFTRVASLMNSRKVSAEVSDVPLQSYGLYPVITISREYGSGGHEIGRLIADELGFTFYDRELIDLTAEQSGFTAEFIKDKEQKLTNSLFYDLYAQNYAYVQEELPPTDLLFLIQSKIIRDICAKGPCVIVGRCANFILKDNSACFNIFIHANDEFRKSKIINSYKAASTYSSKDLELADRKRANYCLHYTGKNWRDSTNYHMTVDSSLFSTESIARQIIGMFNSSRGSGRI